MGGTKYGTIAQAIEGAAANVELKFDGNDSSAGVVSRKSGQTLSIVKGRRYHDGQLLGCQPQDGDRPDDWQDSAATGRQPRAHHSDHWQQQAGYHRPHHHRRTECHDRWYRCGQHESEQCIARGDYHCQHRCYQWIAVVFICQQKRLTACIKRCPLHGSVKAGFSVGGSSYTNVQDALKVVGNSVSGVESLIGSANGPASPDFLTYSVNGRATQDRQNLLQTVQTMNSKGIKYVHTNSSDAGTGTNPDSTDDSSASGANSSAFGVKATTTAAASNAVSMGYKSTAGGVSSVAIGDGAQALGTQSISIGTGNVVKGDHSGAIGDPTIIDAANSYSVGNTNVIGVGLSDVFVLGNNLR